jgi:hypothetical protein
VSPSSGASPEVPGRRKESVPRGSLVQEESREEERPLLPSRRPDKRRRDDSLESNSASIKSNVQLSDTCSLLSHRFSTISISSNVSSDVSLGNHSGVSGSSCYLASMSSADFDDRPALASSFSLSEAEEDRERDTERGPDTQEPGAAQVPKEQLSPPRSAGPRPKLKSLFKRASDGRSKSHSSSHSREGEAECLAVKGRSRISTQSSMTADTSMEQTTCVERRSTSSFEEELLRSKAHDKDVGDDNAFSASDSDDSAEAGGSLTHHRFGAALLEKEKDKEREPSFHHLVALQVLPRLPRG